MVWVGVHLPALSLESFVATLAPEPAEAGHGARVAGEDGEGEGQGDADPIGPVVLIEQHRVVAVNAAARERGLRAGQKRVMALALAPHVRLGEADAARDAAALQAVAHAMMAFTPAVSVAAGHVVLAEVRASLRCFGGLARLLERLRAALAPLGHALRIACAPTPQAAEWLAAWRDDLRADPPRPCPLAGTPAQWRACIGALPVARMAAARPHLVTLRTLGLATVADLWRQPRAGLVRRFGGELLAGIDRATGALADPRESLEPPPVFDSRLELSLRADDSGALLPGAAVLLNRLAAWAAARHWRVAGFELRLHHETRRRLRDDPSARTTTLEIALGEPVADTAHLHALLRERLQRLPLAASVIELSLRCRRLAAGAAPNAELFPSAASAGEGWQRLLERFEARLGAHHIERLHPVADHRPERATAITRGGLDAGAMRAPSTRGEPLRLAPPFAFEGDPAGEPGTWPRLRRPAWLLPEPQPLREQAGTPLLAGRPLWLVAGPERIEAGWWDGAWAARDYFIAQADDGALLWIYRHRYAPPASESGWYLHGRFG